MYPVCCYTSNLGVGELDERRHLPAAWFPSGLCGLFDECWQHSFYLNSFGATIIVFLFHFFWLCFLSRLKMIKQVKETKEFKEKRRRASSQADGEREWAVGGGLAAPVTWILFLSVSTCQHLVWTGLVGSRSQRKGFPWRKSPVPSRLSANQQLLVYSVSSFLTISESHCMENRGGEREGKSDISFWHSTCVFV